MCAEQSGDGVGVTGTGVDTGALDASGAGDGACANVAAGRTALAGCSILLYWLLAVGNALDREPITARPLPPDLV